MCIFKKVKKQKAKPQSKQNNGKIKREKQKYFDYYDDVKHYSKGKEDW